MTNPTVEFSTLGVDINQSLQSDFHTLLSPFPVADEPSVYTTDTSEDYNLAAPRLFGSMVGGVMTEILRALDLYAPAGLDDIFGLIHEINANMPITEPFYILRSVVKGSRHRRPAGSDKPKPYRDHVLHPASMYLLGRRFLSMEVAGTPFEDSFADRVFSSSAGKEAYAFAHRTTPLDAATQRRVIRLAWTIASLSHDLGYAFDVGAYLHELQFKTRLFEPVRVAIADHHRRLAESLQDPRLKPLMKHAYPLVDATFTTPALAQLAVASRLDHGQIFALLLLRTLYADQGNRRILERPDRAMAIYLALRAVFVHDSWTKPENIARPEASDDPFSVFVCLMDLVAELRLIWNRVEPTPKRYLSHWKFDVWLPIQRIEFDPTQTPPALRFQKNPYVPEQLFKNSDYDINLAAGSMTNIIGEPSLSIRAKQDQYVRLLKKLQLSTHDNIDVDIN